MHKSMLQTKKSQLLFWFFLSLIFAAIYSFLALQKAFSSEYVIQDDARQHVFWMGRFLDSSLFPKDLIADYYQSIAPPGYKALYRFMAALGIDPVTFSKFLPGILGLITTGYCFAVCVELLPVPLTGFIGALLLNQNLWMQDGLVSGTAKAFVPPLLLAFLYYFLQRNLPGVGAVLVLFGLFYPPFVLICALVLIFDLWRWQPPYLSRNRRDRWFCAVGLGVAFAVLLPYLLTASEFGPVISLAEARRLPEFQAGARTSFFYPDDPWHFWFNASRTGIRLPSALIPSPVYAGLLLPFMLRFPSFFPLSEKVSPKIIVLLKSIAAGLTLFFAAHALLFALYLPSRYTQHTLRNCPGDRREHCPRSSLGRALSLGQKTVSQGIAPSLRCLVELPAPLPSLFFRLVSPYRLYRRSNPIFIPVLRGATQRYYHRFPVQRSERPAEFCPPFRFVRSRVRHSLPCGLLRAIAASDSGWDCGPIQFRSGCSAKFYRSIRGRFLVVG